LRFIAAKGEENERGVPLVKGTVAVFRENTEKLTKTGFSRVFRVRFRERARDGKLGP
jgi:hypothetical protein